MAFLICFLIIRKSAIINKRRWYFKSAIIVFVLYTLSWFVPVENALITFSSPEATFNYTNSDNVILVVEGEESALVIGDDVSDIIPKSGTGWKQSLAWDVKIVVNKRSSNGIVFWVYQYKDTRDYYVAASDPKGGSIDVTDNRDSVFYHEEEPNNTFDVTIYTYALASMIDDDAF